MSVNLISKCLYVYLLLYSGWNIVESAPQLQPRAPNYTPPSLLTIDLTYKKSTESVNYTKDEKNDAEQFEATSAYLIKKVTNDGQFIWEATGNNYAKKLLVRKDEKGDPKLTLYYHQPIPAPAAYKATQRYDISANKYQPGSLDAYPYGPFPSHVYDSYGYGPTVPGGLAELSRPPVINTSTPVVVVPRRRGSRSRLSDSERGNKHVSFNDSGKSRYRGRSHSDNEKSKGERKSGEKDDDDDDVEIIEESTSSDENKDGDKRVKEDIKISDALGTGKDTHGDAGLSEPRDGKREPRLSASSLDSSNVDNVVLKDLMEMVKALRNDVDLIKETLKNRDFDTSKLTGTATQRQPSVPALVKEFSATGDSSSVKMYAFSPEDESATGADGSQYGNKIVLTVGDHSNVYILDGNSNTMSVSTAKQDDDDDDDEEGGKQGSKMDNVYVNKSVPGAVGNVSGVIPPHSNLFIGGQGTSTPIVMPGVQHTPAHTKKAPPAGSTDDAEEPTPSPASTTTPVAVPAAPTTPIATAVPAAVPSAMPSPAPVATPAAVTAASPATAVPKKKAMDEDRDDNDDEDLKVTDIYKNRAVTPESTDDERKSSAAPPAGGATAVTPPADAASTVPPPPGPPAPVTGLPMPPAGTPIAPPPAMGPPVMTGPIPTPPDGTTIPPPPMVPGAFDPNAAPILVPPPGMPPLSAEGAPIMPLPAFGTGMPPLPLNPDGTTGLPPLPLNPDGATAVPLSFGAMPPVPRAPFAGPMPPAGTPIMPPPGTPLMSGADMSGALPMPGSPLASMPFGTPLPPAGTPLAPPDASARTGMATPANEPAPKVPGGPTPSEEE